MKIQEQKLRGIIKEEIKKIVNEQSGGTLEWGFKQAGFESPRNFKKILSKFNIDEEPQVIEARHGEKYVWKGPGIVLATDNNPVTGEGGSRREPGYASHMAVEGDPETVKLFAAELKLADFFWTKSQAPGSNVFIRMPDYS